MLAIDRIGRHENDPNAAALPQDLLDSSVSISQIQCRNQYRVWNGDTVARRIEQGSDMRSQTAILICIRQLPWRPARPLQ
ncbi:MAG TPA: hypothetical protein VJW73_16230 [Gemmatimonadaceae bacterium]|nr:hypothetical protein [Gemmatimonadaceae bacterium]